MDYETPDGSHFSLREIWRSTNSGKEEFVYTTISATVDDRAYVGRLAERIEDVDEGDVLSALESVPLEAIYPSFGEGMMKAPAFDPSKHYLKAPSFTWDDCQPGVTFVADCVLSEVNVFERLQKHQGEMRSREGFDAPSSTSNLGSPPASLTCPNIIAYHGCVTKDDRITRICLERADGNIVDVIESSTKPPDLAKLISDVKAGIDFIHSLGMAHNDINPDNICIVDGRAVIVDFDGCLPFGEKLMKGVSIVRNHLDYPISAAENDWRGLEDLESFLASLRQGNASAPLG